MAFTIPSVFTAIDRMTRPVQAMAARVNSSMAAMEKKYKDISDVSKKMMVGGAVVGTVIAAPIVYATKKAIAFEDKMADVAKVMNLQAGSAELKKVGDEVMNLSKHLKRPTVEVAELYGNIAQSGVAAKDVEYISRLAGEMGVAYGISADLAGESFVKLKNAMGATIEQTKGITDAINHLGNNTAAKSAELLEFMASGGAGAARNLDIMGEKAAAIGSVWISNGKSAAESGTIFERMMKGILGNAEKMSIFQKAGGGIAGFMAIIEKGSKLKGQAQFKFFESFGQYGTDISMLSKNLDQLKTNLKLVGNAADFADSSNAEFANRQKTTAERLKGVQVNLEILAIKAGEVFLPILEKIIDKISPLIDGLSKWISENQETAKTIGYVAAGVSAFAFVMSGVGAVIQGVIIAVETLTAVITVLSGPVGLIILAIAAMVTWLYLIIKYYDKWGKYVTLLMGPIGILIDLIMTVRKHWDAIGSAFKEGGIKEGIKAIGRALLDFLLSPIKRVLELIGKIPGAAALVQPALDMMNSWTAPQITESKQTKLIRAMGLERETTIPSFSAPKQAKPVSAINPKAEQAKAVASTMTETINNRLSIDINGNPKDFSYKAPAGIPVKLTPNIG